MAMDKRILSAITNCKLGETIILGYKLESGTGMQEGEVFLHVWVRPRKGQDDLCPFCHKHCSGYDSQTAERTWMRTGSGRSTGIATWLHAPRVLRALPKDGNGGGTVGFLSFRLYQGV